MKITWFGTASILIEAAGERILFDPFVQLRGGENPNSIDDFIDEHYICVTHGHLDHLMDVVAFLDPETEGEATLYCGRVAARTLSAQALITDNVVEVKPGMRWSLGAVEMAVYQGKHAQPGITYKMRTLCSPRLLRYLPNALFLAGANRYFPEGGETLVYEVAAEGKRVLLLGSLGLSIEENYPTGIDLLVLPFQGEKRLEEKALEIVERLRPRRIILDHFDDAFPPVSRSVDTRRFKALMDREFPGIQTVKPKAGKEITIL